MGKRNYTVEMESKRDYTVEREARREDTRNKRQERLMCAYLKHAHPAIYEETYAFYNKLDTMYPNKKDLRKTTHFKVFKKKPGKIKKNPPAQGDNFILEIPLMCTETVATRTSQPLPSPPVAASPLPSPPVAASPLPSPPVAASPLPSPPVAASPLPSPPVAASPLPSPPVAASPLPSPPVAAPSLPSPPVAASSLPSPPVAAPSLPSPPVAASPPVVASPAAAPLLPLPSDVYKTLLAELENDPDLWRIFNDFPLQECDEGMNAFVAEDVFMSDDISPLEVELEEY